MLRYCSGGNQISAKIGRNKKLETLPIREKVIKGTVRKDNMEEYREWQGNKGLCHGIQDPGYCTVRRES